MTKCLCGHAFEWHTFDSEGACCEFREDGKKFCECQKYQEPK